MIKCNVTVCGTVSRQAQIRANKEGKQFISFGVKVVIPAKSGINKTIEISVAKDTDNQGEAVNYPVGSRIEVAGVLQFHKKGDIVYFNLSATGVNNFNAGSQDAITGSMEFRGTIGKQVDVKTDKKGNPLSPQFSDVVIQKFKEKVISYLDVVSPEANAIGAIVGSIAEARFGIPKEMKAS